jgi:hypothetical protein
MTPKQAAVLALLADPQWSKWSDREIARHCGATHKIVRPFRADTEVEPRLRTVKRGGVTFTMNTARIGRQRRP